MRALAFAGACAVVVACGASTAPDPRYPARPEGCPVRSYVGAPAIPVDELGDVTVDCSGTNKCGRRLLDEVCRRGGDVVWGLGDNPVTSTQMKGHAAHSSTTHYGPRPEGCDVQVYAQIPPGKTENIGPVTATCGLDVSDADCMRTLKDQACNLGADVLWGVDPPLVRDNKKHLSGRAAHTK